MVLEIYSLCTPPVSSPGGLTSPPVRNVDTVCTHALSRDLGKLKLQTLDARVETSSTIAQSAQNVLQLDKTLPRV